MKAVDGTPAARPRTPTSPLSAGRWSVASFAISQTLGSLLYLPLARILSADDFGLITEAGLIVTGLALVSDVSLTRPLIRLAGDRSELAQATFVLSLIVGLVGAALCALSGPLLSAVFEEPLLVPILALMAPSVLFTALGTVPHALLARELDFRRKTLPETVSIGTGGLLALGAALAGAGVYSLVVYSVARTALSSAVAWWVVRQPVGLHPPRAHTVRRILSFGLPASGGSLALYARLNSDYAITGRRLGSDQLGVYSVAWNMAASPSALINAFFGGVGYATFARLQRDRERMAAVYLAATRLIAAASLPVFCGAIVIRAELVSVLLSDKWAAVVGPVAPLFLLQAIREICWPGAAVTLATGHSRLYALCGLVMLPLTVGAVLIGTGSGITGVAWAMLAAVGGASFVWPAIALTILRPHPSAVLATLAVPALLAAASTPAVALARAVLDPFDVPAPVRLLTAILAGVLAFGAALAVLRRPVLDDLALLRQALPEDTDGAEDEPLDAQPLSLPQPAPAAS